MKKTLVLASLLAAFGAASAQSSVTLFGVVDLSVKSVKSGTNSNLQVGTDGLGSSRFGVRGSESLGNGLSAGFHLEGGLSGDDGVNGKLDFRRRSTASLIGGFGEVRLGRDYTPSFWTTTMYDPFGTNGVGSFGNLAFSTPAAGSALPANVGTFFTNTGAAATAAIATPARTTLSNPNFVRADNSIAFHSANYSGLTFSAMMGRGTENANFAKSNAQYTGFAVAYNKGPVSVRLGSGKTKGYSGTVGATTAADAAMHTGIGASYNFGFAKLIAQISNEKFDMVTAGSITEKSTLVGVTVPFGATTLKASYATKKDGSLKAANQIAVGADYALSPRTKVYTTYSALSNNAGSITLQNVGLVPNATGAKSKGFEFGVNHAF